MNLKVINKNNHFNFVCYILLALPVIFLLKHNIANFLVSILPLFFFSSLIKKKIFFKKNLIFFYLFFIYLILISLWHHNQYGFYFLRFFCLSIFIIFILNEKYIYNFKKVLKLFILFIIADLLAQSFFGYNIVMIESEKDYSASFFGDEKVAGTYLLNMLFIYTITVLYSEDNNNLKFLIYIFPLTILAMLICGQRVSLINLIIFYFLLILTSIYFKKIKINFSIFFILLLSIVIGKIFFQDKTTILYGKLEKVSKSINSKDNKKKRNITFINHDNYSKIKFRNFINDEKAEFSYQIFYEDVFAHGYKNNSWHEIRIKDLINSKRLINKKFTFANEKEEVSERIKKILQNEENNTKNSKENYTFTAKDEPTNDDKDTIELSNKAILEYLNRDHVYNSNDWIITFTTIENINSNFKDLGWYAHFFSGYLIWKDNLLFGAGIKKFRELSQLKKYRSFDSFASNFTTTHPHNIFIELAAETGIFGISIFYLLISSLVIQILRADLPYFNKINLIIILIILFQPFQTTGRFFSSNIALFNFYIIGLNFYFLISKKTSEKIFEKT